MGNLQFKVDMEKPVRPNRQAGLGFLILLALPFAVLGVFELAQALQKWSQGGLKEANLDCLVGLVFVSVGFGLRHGLSAVDPVAAHPAFHGSRGLCHHLQAVG